MPDRQEDLTSTEPDLAVLLVGAYRAVVARLVTELAEFDVRPAHGFVLRALHDHPMTLTALASLLDVTKQSVAGVVDEMEARGLLTREPIPEDRRAKRLRLTARGDSARARALSVSSALERELVDAAGHEAVAGLRRALLELVERHGEGGHAAARRARPVW
jgi:DNA-binding MarR family transcriptional regulator